MSSAIRVVSSEKHIRRMVSASSEVSMSWPVALLERRKSSRSAIKRMKKRELGERITMFDAVGKNN